MRNILLVLAILINSVPAVQAVAIGKKIEFIGPGRTLGIDIIKPDTSAKLDVNGQVLIRGGFTTAPAAGLVLTTVDTNGLAAWSVPAVSSTVANSNNATTANFADTAGSATNATNLTGAGTITNTTIDGFVDFSANADLQGHTVNGDLVADSFTGDGSALTNLSASAINGNLTNVTNINSTNINNSILNGTTTVNGTVVFETGSVINGDNLTTINFDVDNATTANFADSAATATTANFATNAASATNADNATTASLADIAVLAINANNAATADLANAANFLVAADDTTLGANVDSVGNLVVTNVLRLRNPSDGVILSTDTGIAGQPEKDGFRILRDNNFFAMGTDAIIFDKTDANGLTNPDGAIVFTNTANDNVMDVSMVIRGNGNIGIGIAAPQAKLHVNGDLIVEGNIYTPGNPWILVHSNDFESSGSESGWGTNRTACDGTNILGGFGELSTASITKSFDLSSIPHSAVKVKFNYYSLDTWDDEDAVAKIDNRITWSKNLVHYVRPHNRNGHQVAFPGCGSGGSSAQPDRIFTGESMKNHTADSLSLSFGSTLNSSATNESYGIDNLEIWVKATALPGTVIPSPPGPVAGTYMTGIPGVQATSSNIGGTLNLGGPTTPFVLSDPATKVAQGAPWWNNAFYNDNTSFATYQRGDGYGHDAVTVQKLCEEVTGLANIEAQGIKVNNWSSPSDNYVVSWNGSSWIRGSGGVSAHLGGLDCVVK